jgi:cholesterol transport system auxiliary component
LILDIPVLSRKFAARLRCHGVTGGMLLMLAGCSGGSTPTTFDLTAPNPGRMSGGSRSYLVVAEPSTVQALDSDRIIVRDTSGAISFLGNSQWADRVPRLVQTRLIQTFENAGRLGSVGRPGDRIVSDVQMNTDIRAFTVETATGEALVEITAKLVNDKTGRVRAAKLFSARVPLGAIEGSSAATAMNSALSIVLTEIVRWAGRA